MPKYYTESGFAGEIIYNCHTPQEALFSLFRNMRDEIIYRLSPIIYLNELGFMFPLDEDEGNSVKSLGYGSGGIWDGLEEYDSKYRNARKDFRGEVFDFSKDVAVVEIQGKRVERDISELSEEGCCLIFKTDQVFRAMKRGISKKWPSYLDYDLFIRKE